MYRHLLGLSLLLSWLTSINSMTFSQNKCNGAHLVLQCKPKYLIQVENVYLRHLTTCHSNNDNLNINCTRSSNKFHACTGVKTCIVKVPEVLIEECGVSNSLQITYSCIKESELKDICDFSTDVTDVSGYLATPGYPTVWQPVTGTCSITISLRRNWRLRFYIRDQGQMATDQPQGCIFLVTFRALLNKRRTGLFPETSVCLDNGYSRNQLIYESTTNIVQLQYRVLLPVIKTGDKFGFLFYYEGYQLVPDSDGNMSSTTVPPTVVLEANQQAARPDHMIQLRPHFRTAAVPIVNAQTTAVSTTRPLLPEDAVTPETNLMHTDPLRIVQTGRRRTDVMHTDPLRIVQTGRRRTDVMHTDPLGIVQTGQRLESAMPTGDTSRNVQAAGQQINEVTKTDPLGKVQIPGRHVEINTDPSRNVQIPGQQNTRTAPTAATTTLMIRELPITEANLRGNNTERDHPAMTAVVSSSDRLSIRQFVHPATSTTVSRDLSVKQTTQADLSRSDQMTPTSPSHPNSHPIRSHVITVNGDESQSRDFSHRQTKKTQQSNLAEEVHENRLPSTRHDIRHDGMTTRTTTDVVYETTDVGGDTVNRTDVYNTTAVSTNIKWKSKWAKIVGALMVALALVLVSIIVLTMVAERRRKQRQRRRLHIGAMFDDVSQLGGCDDRSRLASGDESLDSTTYSGGGGGGGGSTASTVTLTPPLTADVFGWHNEAYAACLHEYRNCVLPYENCRRPAAPLPSKDRLFVVPQQQQQQQQPDYPDWASDGDGPPPIPSRSGTGRTKIRPPVPVRRSLTAEQDAGRDDGSDASRTAPYHRDLHNGTTTYKHAVVIELRNSPASDSIRLADKLLPDVTPNDMISTLPVYSYTTP